MTGASTRRGLRATAALCAGLLLLLSGCGFRGAYSFSLPGGADIGDNPYSVQVEFLDVLDLVQQSGVKVADVPVGRVDKIELQDDWTALVTLTVNGNVDLPANAVAKIQQSSLLGEKFIELAAPGNEKPEGKLRDHPHIPLERTNRNVEVEELLGALSLVLNGGGLAQLQTINKELGEALQGRESAVRSTLTELDTFSAGSTRRRRRSTGRWTARTLSRARWPPAPAPSTPRWPTSVPAWTSSTSSATCWCRCCRAWPASATSAPASSTSPPPTRWPTCSCCSRS